MLLEESSPGEPQFKTISTFKTKTRCSTHLYFEYVVRDVDCYDPEKDEWFPQPPLCQYRVAHSVVACPVADGDQAVLVIGGSAKSGADAFHSEGLKTVEMKRFNAKNDASGDWKVCSYDKARH